MARLTVRVTPNASRDELVGFDDQGVLRVRLRARALDGKANQALVEFMADKVNLKKQSIQILNGAKNRLKIIEIEGGEEILERFKLEK